MQILESSSRVGLDPFGCGGLVSILGCCKLVWEMVDSLKCALIALIELEGLFGLVFTLQIHPVLRLIVFCILNYKAMTILINERVAALKNSFKWLEETVQKSLQQITQTIAGLTTHENEDQPVFGVPRRPNRGRGNGRPQRQPFQQHNYGGEDSDVENEYEDEREVRGMRFGHRGAADFDYRQRAKDVPTFHGSMNVEDFLDWMSELDTFFKFYEIPMDNRVNLVAYKLKGGAQSCGRTL
ncbi:hypothetical protein Tco_1266063 [Tanacetum coccineum]